MKISLSTIGRVVFVVLLFLAYSFLTTAMQCVHHSMHRYKLCTQFGSLSVHYGLLTLS